MIFVAIVAQSHQHKRWAFISADPVTSGFANRCLDSLGEDIADAEGVIAQRMRVDAQRHGWISVAKPGGPYMHRTQQGAASLHSAGVDHEDGRGERSGRTSEALRIGMQNLFHYLGITAAEA